MLNAFVARFLRQQEERTGEPVDYLRDLYEAAPGGFWRFVFFTPMSRFGKCLPPDALAVARIAAVHAEDCGPCLQIVVNLTTAAGVPAHVLRAAVTRNLSAMDERTRTVFEFAEAIVHRDIRSEELRPLIENWWGKAAIADLALTIASTRVFPTMKRVMGYGQACSRVTIGQETIRADLANPQAA